MRFVTPESFQKAGMPGADFSKPLVALWLDAQGRWDEAHAMVQEDDSPEGAWVHAYLHRREGDASNARHWYARAARPVFSGSLEGEWEFLTATLLTEREEERRESEK